MVLSLVLLEDKTADLVPVLGLESKVLGPGLEPLVLVNMTAPSECDTLAIDTGCFADNAVCYNLARC